MSGDERPAAEPIVLHRCPCGAPARVRHFWFAGQKVGTAPICDGCFDAGEAQLARVRPVFDAMLGVGVSREIANEVMCYLTLRLDQSTQDNKES